MESVPVRSSFAIPALCLVLTAPLARAADPPAVQPEGTKGAAPPASAAPGTAPAAPAPAPAPPASTPTPPASTAPMPPPPAAGGPNAAQNTVKLRDLERRVDELKEQVFRSKARLNLLKETVLHGVIAGARATIMHKNEMGYTFMPVRFVYALDGAEIFARSADSGALGQATEHGSLNGSLLPG